MEKLLKRSGWFYVVVAMIYAILGIIIIINPQEMLNIVSLIAGIIFLIVGIVKVINYFILKGNYDFYNYELIHGLVAFLIGVIILAYTNTISMLFIILIGIWITYSGLISLTLSMKMQAIKIPSWIPIFIISLIMMIIGIYIIAAPESIMIFVGALMIAYAVMELIENLVFIKHVDEISKD